MEHHDATGVTTPRQTVKASPHRHKWMLSPGAPADPSDPWNSHSPVSPRQNGQRKLVRLNGPPETLRVLAVAQQAADTLATTCPQAVSAEPTAQLEAVEQAIDAVAPLPRQRRSASAGFCAVTPQRKARASIIAARVVCFCDRLRAV
jgi:hypothetical protein